MNRREGRIKGWCKSLGIAFLAVLIVGAILGTAERFMSARPGRPDEAARAPKRPGTPSNESVNDGPSELSRKIAASLKRKADKPPIPESAEPAKAPEDKSAFAKLRPSDLMATSDMRPTETKPVAGPTVAASATAPVPEPGGNGATRTAAQILDDLSRSRNKRPKGRTPRADQVNRDEENRRRAALIGELYGVDPKRSQMPTLLIERWLTLRDDPAAKSERETAAARPPGDAIGDSAAYVGARLAVEDPAVDSEQALKLIGAFGARTKNRSPRVRELLGTLADRMTEDPARRREIYQRIVELYPNSRDGALAMDRLAQLDDEKFRDIVTSNGTAADPAVGKVFEFSFQDAVSGEPISSDGLRGRVMVVDFWATWCGPCVAAMPHLKELYAKYNPKGVAFIGISLDNPDSSGLQKLLKFVSENEVPWPQYHQKNRELSSLWNITGIPTVFVVDKAGRIVSKGGNLDQILSKLVEDGPASRRPRS